MLYQNGLGTEQSYSYALYYYELASKKVSVSAQIVLGLLYSESKGVQQSLQKAVEYYEKAVGQSYPSAYDYLAEAYKKGIGFAETQNMAFTIIKKNSTF